MDIKLDLPSDLFDAEFTEAAFGRRVWELAVLELVRLRRLHEHEAQAMLGIGRWELVERMKAVGITPTEETFEELRGELERAIRAKNRR